jgi:hypothetical protein
LAVVILAKRPLVGRSGTYANHRRKRLSGIGRPSLANGHVSVPACALSFPGQDSIQGTLCGQKGMTGWCPSRRLFPEEECIMLKLSLWIGTPSIITYLASTYSQLLENNFYIFALSAAALVVGILSQISEKSGS